MPKIIENLESRLMEEAKRQIEESGYGAVTIRSVAKGCGVGVGTVYNYFPSKDDLVASFMLADWKECLAAITETGARSTDAMSVLRCITISCAYSSGSIIVLSETRRPPPVLQALSENIMLCCADSLPHPYGNSATVILLRISSLSPC